jgi:hypothetical protein
VASIALNAKASYGTAAGLFLLPVRSGENIQLTFSVNSANVGYFMVFEP